jgi:predicted TIM-barrel fold metal-dependent hydrolase
MDDDGVQVQLLWPNAVGFAGERLRYLGDPALWYASVRAYNDYVLTELCAAYPSRLLGVGVVPVGDPAAAAEEAARAIGLGARAISFPHHLDPLGVPPLFGGAWDRMFSVLEDAGVPLLVHIGQGVGVPEGRSFGGFGSLLTYMNFDVLGALVDFVFSLALLGHPGLKVGFVEGGVAWLPYVTERMDFFLKRAGVWDQSPGVPLPSELVRRSVYASFIDDPNGIRWRDEIGVDRILWQSDFPHRDSFWPRSRSVLEGALADIPDADARRIAEDNARELLRIPRAA